MCTSTKRALLNMVYICQLSIHEKVGLYIEHRPTVVHLLVKHGWAPEAAKFLEVIPSAGDLEDS